MSDLAELMSRDPLSLSDQDLDEIIATLRKARANYTLGVKAEKPKATAKLDKIDLTALGLIPTAAGS